MITTDGLENDSRRYSYEDVKRMIEKKQDKKGWEFVFMGANIDAAAEAARIGIDPKYAAEYCADSCGTQAVFQSMAAAACQARSVGSVLGSWKDVINCDKASRA